MAGKNQVTLTFAGDTSALERAAARASRTTDKLGKDFDRLGTNLAKQLPKTIFSQLGDAASMALKAIPAQVQAAAAAAGAGIGAVMAPAIGAAISSGVLLGVGGGVLAAGIALVAKNPIVSRAASALKDKLFDKDLVPEKEAISKAEGQVQAAFDRLAKARELGQKKGVESALYDIKIAKKKLADANKGLADAQAFNAKNMSLRDLAAPFAVPVAKALDTFGKSFERMKPGIADLFVTMAPAIDKLAPALATIAERALPGIQKAAEASLPLFDKLAEHAPKIGDALTKMFTLIANGGPGATKFFDHLLTALEVSIINVGIGLNFLSTQYDNMVTNVTRVKDALIKAANAVEGAFKGAWNGIAKAWNNTVGKLSFRVPDWVPGLGGKTFSAPKLPTFHTGGIVSGAMGAETLAVLRAGERVTPAGGGGGQPIVIEFRSNDRAELERIKRMVTVHGGGNVQVAFGR